MDVLLTKLPLSAIIGLNNAVKCVVSINTVCAKFKALNAILRREFYKMCNVAKAVLKVTKRGFGYTALNDFTFDVPNKLFTQSVKKGWLITNVDLQYYRENGFIVQIV